MKLIKILSSIIEFLSYGVLKVFSPQKDDYPVVGAMAYTGEIYKERTKHKKFHR
jgi:hypothetical protein